MRLGRFQSFSEKRRATQVATSAGGSRYGASDRLQPRSECMRRTQHEPASPRLLNAAGCPRDKNAGSLESLALSLRVGDAPTMRITEAAMARRRAFRLTASGSVLRRNMSLGIASHRSAQWL